MRKREELIYDMADQDTPNPEQQNGDGRFEDIAGGAPTAEETLAALLRDLRDLEGYLTQRGRHTYELAQRFLENARRSEGSSRAFDERQATMLEYQHYIWHEIAGMVNKLLVTYGEPESAGPDSDEPAQDGNN